MLNDSISISNRDFGALILAGGHSSRMGSPKPWLIFDGQITFLEHLAGLYRQAGTANVVSVVNSSFCGSKWAAQCERAGALSRIIENPHPDRGRLYSLHLGLKHLTPGHVLIQNVDSPFVSSGLVRQLMMNPCELGVSIPVHHGKKGHPVLIGPEIKHAIVEHWEEFKTLRHVLADFPEALIETTDKGMLIDLNTEQQYLDAKKWTSTQK